MPGLAKMVWKMEWEAARTDDTQNRMTPFDIRLQMISALWGSFRVIFVGGTPDPPLPPPRHRRPVSGWERVPARQPRRGEGGLRQWVFVTPPPPPVSGAVSLPPQPLCAPPPPPRSRPWGGQMPGTCPQSHVASGWIGFEMGTSSRWHHERVPHLSPSLNPPLHPPPQQVDNAPPSPIHTWGIPSSKGKQVRSP